MKRFFYGASIGACFGLLFSTAHAALPLTWQVSNPPPTNNRLNAVTYGNGHFMAVGVDRTILRSEDGVNWQLQLNAPGAIFWSATFGNGIFVVGGGPRSLLGSSADDGVNWNTSQSTAGIEGVFGLAFGNGLFVGVGQGPSSPSAYIVTSANGVNWQSHPSPTANALHGVGYGNNIFVAVGELGTIITSSDGVNWTTRNSGTGIILRAVTFNGSRFIVGGNSGTTLTSTDGISWSPAAPASFDIYGLASGGGAVVGVGDYQGAGRAQGSPDGLTWPGNAAEFPNAIYGVTYRPDYFVAVGENGLILRSSGIAPNGTNSWTKPTSGNWEEPYWSLGELPNISQPAIAFNNSGFKALAIANTTAVNYPSSLTIQNLLVDAPADSSNLLLLNYAGLDVPLRITNDFRIGPGGVLLSLASSLIASNLYLDGRATFAEYGQTETLTLTMGNTAAAELTLSNGWFNSLQETVSVSAPAVFRQFGGTNHSVGLEVGAGGTYDLRGGTCFIAYVPGLSMHGGAFFNQGGTLEAGNLSIESGMFSQSAGTSIVHGDFGLVAPNGTAAAANVSLSGGILASSRGYLFIGGTAGRGSFSQSGGFLTNWYYLPVSAGSHYSLTGGRMDVEQIRVSGTFEQTGGTNIVGDVSLDGTGVYNRTGGFLSVDQLYLWVHSQFHRGNSSFVNGGGFPLIQFSGGSFFAGAGTNEMGFLHVFLPPGSAETESTLDLESGGASVLKFRDSSHDFTYSSTLTITNWAGSTNGGGTDRIYVGTNQFGLTSDQLAHIAFARPAGLAAANYQAKLLATGEMVPDTRGPVLGFSRNNDTLLLSWNNNSFELLSSTNVVGPYQPLSPQPSSPYTVSFSDPQRFFKLRSK